jgi:predicted Fe-Mo cluster-binding NifX family protein
MSRFPAFWSPAVQKEENTMKIAVTSTGPQLDDQIDPRFGRAAYILVIDTQTLDFEVVDNRKNVQAFKGAGIQAATLISGKGAQVLLTGYCGPKAFTTLVTGGIKVGQDVTGTVREAVARFNAGTIPFSETANAEAHW